MGEKMKSLFAIGIALTVAAAGCKVKERPDEQEAPQQQMKIDFTVHKQGNALTFKSAEGAAWEEVGYACKALPCEFVLNDHGTDPKTPAEVFSIGFSFSGNDVKMISVNMAPKKGTTWEILAYSCRTTDCDFRVTEEGVTGL
jgi:hypothetical protein